MKREGTALGLYAHTLLEPGDYHCEPPFLVCCVEHQRVLSDVLVRVLWDVYRYCAFKWGLIYGSGGCNCFPCYLYIKHMQFL